MNSILPLLIVGGLVWLFASGASKTRSSGAAASRPWSNSSYRSDVATPAQSRRQSTNTSSIRNPNPYDDSPAPLDSCRCGGTWIRKVNAATGGRFWGCSRFPACKNTRESTQPGMSTAYRSGGAAPTQSISQATSRSLDSNQNSYDNSPAPIDRCDCGGTWIRRFNEATGGYFWGCSRVATCTNSRDAQLWKHRRWEMSNPAYSSKQPVRPSPTPRPIQKRSPPPVRLPSSGVDANSLSSRSGEKCRNGHPRTPANTYVRPNGSRECRICRREAR